MTFSGDENLDENCCYFDLNLTEVCLSGFNKQYAIIGSANGLAPMRQQAINWTNYGLVHWHIHVSPDLNNIAVIKSPSSLRHIVQFPYITVDLQNTHNGHQYLTCSNKIWDAFCESKIKSIFRFCPCRDVYNIVKFVLLWDQTVVNLEMMPYVTYWIQFSKWHMASFPIDGAKQTNCPTICFAWCTCWWHDNISIWIRMFIFLITIHCRMGHLPGRGNLSIITNQ